MTEQDVKFEGSLETLQVIAYLEDLIKGLKDGKICVQERERFVTLSPADVINLEIEARQKKGSEKFSLELSWAQKNGRANGTLPLKISTEEPKVKDSTITLKISDEDQKRIEQQEREKVEKKAKEEEERQAREKMEKEEKERQKEAEKLAKKEKEAAKAKEKAEKKAREEAVKAEKAAKEQAKKEAREQAEQKAKMMKEAKDAKEKQRAKDKEEKLRLQTKSAPKADKPMSGLKIFGPKPVRTKKTIR